MKMETVSIFKRVFLCLLVLVPAACGKSTPKRNLTCTNTGFIVQYHFDAPFQGIVYADDRLDSECSFRPITRANVRDVTLNVSYNSCGSSIQFVENGISTVTVKIVIQWHTILKTTNDIIDEVSCPVSDLPKSYLGSSRNKSRSLEGKTRLELKLGHEVLGTSLASVLGLSSKQLLVLRVPNKGRYVDLHVKDCVLHEDLILDDDSFLYPLGHPSRCQNNSLEFLSKFHVINSTETKELLAFARIKSIHSLTKSNLYISCGAQLCRKTCKRKCGRGKSRDTLSTIATHKITKRSIGYPDQPIRKKSDIRNSLLKSTIKALSQTLINKSKEPKQRNGTLKKRALDVAETGNLTAFEETGDFGIPPDDVSNSEVKFSTTSPMEYEIVVLNVVNDTDDGIASNDTNDGLVINNTSDVIELIKDFDDLRTEATLDGFPHAEFSDRNASLKFIKALSSIITKQYKKLTLLNDVSNERLVKTKGNSKIPKSADSESSTFVSINSDEVSSTSSNGYQQGLSTHEEFDIAQFITDFGELPATTLLPTSSIPEDIDATVSIAPTEVSESNMMADDAMKSLNGSVIDGYSIKLNIDRSAGLDLDYKNKLNSLCVSEMTFMAVSIALGFVIFVLMMTCCGMALYIRKEKKRHLIDNFLLYNFY